MNHPITALMVSLLVLAIGMVGNGVTLSSRRAPDLAPAAQDAVVHSEASTPSPANGALPGITSQYIGVTFVRDSADIASRAAGALTAVYVQVGDRVRLGDAIAAVDSPSLQHELRKAYAALRSLEAEVRGREVELNEAELRARRREELMQAGLISREERDAAAADVERKRAAREMALARSAEQAAQIAQVEEAVAAAIVRAPFDGTVAERHLSAGAVVQPGTPIISLMRSGNLGVRFAVPSSNDAMRPGTALSFAIRGLDVVIPGVVELAPVRVDAMSNDLVLEARLSPPDALRDRIRPGLTGFVSVMEVTRGERGQPIPR
jgi:RND family efflux transporter MFP subunit